MYKIRTFGLLSGLLLISAIVGGCGSAGQVDANGNLETIRVGYFPNITHAQAMVGLENGTFQAELGTTNIETYTFNAGPAEIEALFAGQIDLAYIGPSPALNGFVQSYGEALRIVSGSMSGGAAFVVQPELAEAYRTQGDSAFVGKTFASPQQGNTQDVSLRHYFSERNLLDQVTISPMANADQISLFAQDQLDGSWVPEPWASRLVSEAGAEVLVDERDLWENGAFSTTVVIVSTEFLEAHPTAVEAWLKGHVAVTDWINEHPTEAQAMVNTEIEELTGAALDATVLANAWERLDPSYAPNQSSIDAFRATATDLGFIEPGSLDFTTLYDFTILNQITGRKY